MTDHEEVDFMTTCRTDFATFTRPQLVRHLEVEGFAVFPEILPPDLIAKIKAELADIEGTQSLLRDLGIIP